MNVIVASQFTILRDGGSKVHEVLNPEECGYIRVIQDHSIMSKKRGIEGSWTAMSRKNNITEYDDISEQDIAFI